MRIPIPTHSPLPLRAAARRRERGQALVIIAVSFVGIAAFIGLAIDLGILIVGQAHLRRAVDSAAIAAATQMREGQSLNQIGQFAAQYITLNGVQLNTLIVQQCISGDLSNILQWTSATSTTTTVPDTSLVCNTVVPRKLIRVEARAPVTFAFLGIIGVYNTTLVADAVSEAASVDIVLVFGTGETMGQNTAPRRPDGCNVNCGTTFNPNSGGNPGCNVNAGPQISKEPEVADGALPKCRPLWDAKQAAKKLLDTLYVGFDRVAVVGYDFMPRVYGVLTPTLGYRASISAGECGARVPPTAAPCDATGVYASIDSLVVKNDAAAPGQFGFYNPWNVNCRSGSFGSSQQCTAAGYRADPLNSNVSNCIGCGIRTAANILKQTGRPDALWIIIFLSDGFPDVSDLPDDSPTVSRTSIYENVGAAGFSVAAFPNGYCPGAVGATAAVTGTRMFTRPLCLQGGFDVNGDGDVSDTGVTSATLPTRFGTNWSTWPFNEQEVWNPNIRYCGPYHATQGACPPGALFLGSDAVSTTAVTQQGTLPNGVTAPYYYTPLDYAKDMIDQAALTTICVGDPVANCSGGGWPPTAGQRYNRNETIPGNPIVVYSIGLNNLALLNVPDETGEKTLRYMAAVGDDGDRVTDPCLGIPTANSCGNYYFAPDPSALGPIFEDIAKRIFTRLTR
ncbi:MAG: pilus assembly protein TadG-related protein [Anaerolineales bacterium]